VIADLFMKGGATYSKDNSLRFSLSREWGDGPCVVYIGHNPSTAGHETDDPTSLAWVDLAKANGCTRYVAVNLYPFRSSDPQECRRWAAWEKNGPDWWARDSIHQNMGLVADEAKKADIVVACWGALAQDDAYVEAVIEEIQSGVEPCPQIYCVGTTISGAPKHPLARGKHRVPRDQKFMLWRPVL
jgi:hypothetical protein